MNPPRLRLRTAALLPSLLLALATSLRCLGTQPASKGEPAPPAVPVTFQLDWKPNAQFAGILLAKDRGWYREAGIDLSVRPIPPDESVVRSVVTNRLWLGCAESGVLLPARARGEPIRVVGTMLQGSPMCLISLRPARLRKPADLRGRRIGVHADGNDAIDFVLRPVGLDRTSVRVEVMPYDTTPLLEGRFDAVQGYSVDEAIELRLAGHDIDLMFFHDHGYAAYAQVYFTSEAMLAERPDLVRRFLEVSARGWKAAARERDAAVSVILAGGIRDTDRVHQRKALDELVPLLTREGGRNSHGRMRKATWTKAVDEFNSLPTAARKITVDELVSFEFQR